MAQTEPFPKWEYKKEWVEYLTEEALNELGGQGWELTETWEGVAVFKRPLKAKGESVNANAQ